MPARQDWRWKGSDASCAASPSYRWRRGARYGSCARAGGRTCSDRAGSQPNCGSAIVCASCLTRSRRAAYPLLARGRHRGRPVRTSLARRLGARGDELRVPAGHLHRPRCVSARVRRGSTRCCLLRTGRDRTRAGKADRRYGAPPSAGSAGTGVRPATPRRRGITPFRRAAPGGRGPRRQAIARPGKSPRRGLRSTTCRNPPTTSSPGSTRWTGNWRPTWLLGGSATFRSRSSSSIGGSGRSGSDSAQRRASTGARTCFTT